MSKSLAKPFADALKRSMLENDGEALRAIADKIRDLARGGDMQAIKEVADRMDGKAVQSIAADIDTNVIVEIMKFAEG